MKGAGMVIEKFELSACPFHIRESPLGTGDYLKKQMKAFCCEIGSGFQGLPTQNTSGTPKRPKHMTHCCSRLLSNSTYSKYL